MLFYVLLWTICGLQVNTWALITTAVIHFKGMVRNFIGRVKMFVDKWSHRRPRRLSLLHFAQHLSKRTGLTMPPCECNPPQHAHWCLVHMGKGTTQHIVIR